jgi:AcrR family transcriptional regulator
VAGAHQPSRVASSTKDRNNPRSGERSARRAERREELLDAAIGVVRAEGAGASMEAMANAGGVTKPILYRHFGDREGLIAAMSSRFADGISETVIQTLGTASEAEPRDVLHASIDAYVSFIEADTELYRFLVQQDGRRGGQATMALADTIARRVTQVLDGQLAILGRDTGPAEPWAYGIVGMIHLAGDWWVDRRTMSRTRLVDELTNLLWSGLDGARAVEPRADRPA